MRGCVRNKNLAHPLPFFRIKNFPRTNSHNACFRNKDFIETMKKNNILRPFSDGDKYGFIDGEGTLKIKPQFDEVDVYREGVCWVRLDDKWGLIDTEGKFLIVPRFEEAREFNDGLANVKISGYWGVVNRKGEIIIRPEFDFIDSFKNGVAYIKKNGKYGFVFLKDNRIIAPLYDDIRGFSEGYAAVKVNGLWGYINEEGNMVLEPKFSQAKKFRNGKAYVQIGEKIGTIDKEGRPIGSFHEYEDYYDFNYEDEPWYDRGIRTRHGFIDKNGQFAIKPKFQNALSFNKEGFAIVKIDRKWGIIDVTGTYMIEPRYEDIRRAGDNIYEISQEGKKYFIDINGNKVPAPKLKPLDFVIPDDCLRAVKIGDKWGFENAEGEIVISPLFDHARDFEDGYAHIQINRKDGIIDKEGKFVIEPLYSNLGRRFENGYLRVEVTGDEPWIQRWGVVDSKGKVMVPPRYEYVMATISEDMARISKGEKFGFVDCKTEKEISPVFDYVWDFSNGLAHVRLTEKEWEEGLCKTRV